MAKNTYTGSFEIEHGVKGGLGKYDDTITERKELVAPNEANAFEQAYHHAAHLSNEYLSNSSGNTTVTLTLQRPDGKWINQMDIVRELYKRKHTDPKVLQDILDSEMPDGKLKVVSTLTHKILASSFGSP